MDGSSGQGPCPDGEEFLGFEHHITVPGPGGNGDYLNVLLTAVLSVDADGTDLGTPYEDGPWWIWCDIYHGVDFQLQLADGTVITFVFSNDDPSNAGTVATVTVTKP